MKFTKYDKHYCRMRGLIYAHHIYLTNDGNSFYEREDALIVTVNISKMLIINLKLQKTV